MACIKALPLMKAGQLVTCVPGAQAMSLKKEFVNTWQQVSLRQQVVG
jgi:hypothetical protein